MTKSIDAYQDGHGRIIQWPSDRRRAHQLAVLEHLALLLDGGERYERAAVERLLADHTVGLDVDELLAELLETGYVTAAPDGETLWRSSGR